MKTLKVPFDPIKRLLKRVTGGSSEAPYAEVFPYEIRIILRGEQLLYRDQRGAVIIEISLPGRWIKEPSIDRWDGERSVSSSERKEIVERVISYFRRRQGMEMTLVGDGK
jgi:hypothetical protein